MDKSADQKRIEEVFFQAKPCLKAHVYLLRAFPHLYVPALSFLCDSGTISVISTGVRARVLAALHITGQHKAVVKFLKSCEVVDIVKGLHILDRNRKVKQLERRIESIEMLHPHVRRERCEQDTDEHLSGRSKRKKPKETNRDDEDAVVQPKRRRHRQVDKYRQAKATLESEEACPVTNFCALAHEDDATREVIQSASVSGALAAKIRSWTKACLRPDFLEFTLLAMPLDPWKQLADIVHLSPSDFLLPYFLEEVYKSGDQLQHSEKETFVTCMRRFMKEKERNKAQIEEQFFAIAHDFPQVFLNYSLIRRYSELTGNVSIMEQFAARAPLDVVLWFFEEFHNASEHCEEIIADRIKESDDSALSGNSKTTYGKLVERILTLRRLGISFADELIPMAAARLEMLRASWSLDQNTRKVAVFGDASSSMQSAIESATIFSSMISVCFDGELSFFAGDCIPSPHAKPRTVHEALEVCTKVRANGCTSLAAALWPYFEEKIWVDVIVMVTDEEENTRKHGHFFDELLEEYKKTVNPAVALVIVCVGGGDSSFRRGLERRGIVYKLVQIDYSRPDHAKFDALLGQIALLCTQKTNEPCAPLTASTNVKIAPSSIENDFVLL